MLSPVWYFQTGPRKNCNFFFPFGMGSGDGVEGTPPLVVMANTVSYLHYISDSPLHIPEVNVLLEFVDSMPSIDTSP